MKNRAVENDIIELQSKIAFQEDLIQHINLHVSELTRECADLKKQVRQMNQKFDLLSDQWQQLVSGHAGEKPPHY